MIADSSPEAKYDGQSLQEAKNMIDNLSNGTSVVVYVRKLSVTNIYGKPFYYLLCKVDILYVISDILYLI